LEAAHFVLGVGVSIGEDGWENGARLTLSQVDPLLPLLEEHSLLRLGGFARDASSGQWVQVNPAANASDAAQPTSHFEGGLWLENAVTSASARPGESLAVSLTWRAEEKPAADYSVFVQLLDAGGANVAQWDGAPADAVSKLPASAWPVGWRGHQEVSMALPETLSPGVYAVIVGMYDWQTGQRLPVNGRDSVTIDSVTIGRVEQRE
jgi:hypothetical protein